MKQLRKTKRPVVRTVKGIRQGLDDVKRGKVRPAREFFADFEAEHGIPR